MATTSRLRATVCCVEKPENVDSRDRKIYFYIQTTEEQNMA